MPSGSISILFDSTAKTADANTNLVRPSQQDPMSRQLDRAPLKPILSSLLVRMAGIWGAPNVKVTPSQTNSYSPNEYFKLSELGRLQSIRSIKRCSGFKVGSCGTGAFFEGILVSARLLGVYQPNWAGKITGHLQPLSIPFDTGVFKLMLQGFGHNYPTSFLTSYSVQ